MDAMTLIVFIAAACFAGVRLLTFVYSKKHDRPLEEIDAEFASTLREGDAHESEASRPLQ